MPSLLPLVDRKLYPADRYPDGQWDYYRFYLTHFDQTVTDFNADIPATLAAIYRRCEPELPRARFTGLPWSRATEVGSVRRIAPRRRRRIPALWPTADFDALVEAFRVTGFRPGNSWYLNDTANIAYAHAAPDGGRLRQPVLFVNGEFDGICDITRSRLGEPMRGACADLSVTNLQAGHWLPLERKTELVAGHPLMGCNETAVVRSSLEQLFTSPFAGWKVDHAAIRVPDFDAAIAWYTEKLDFRLKQHRLIRRSYVRFSSSRRRR